MKTPSVKQLLTKKIRELIKEIRFEIRENMSSIKSLIQDSDYKEAMYLDSVNEAWDYVIDKLKNEIK